MKTLRLILLMCVLACLCSCGSKRNVHDRAEDYIAAEMQSSIDKQKKKDKKQGKKDDSDAKGRARKVIDEAQTWKGTPYRYGGHSKKGADCSGFVMAVFDNAIGLKLPRTSHDQSKYCKTIKKGDLRAGDLVFFHGGKKGKVSHVGIYIGKGKFIHASSSRGVIISDMADSYYVRNFNHAGRVL